MPPEISDLIVRSTAWVVVTCYLLRCWNDYRGARQKELQKSATYARWFWTVGCLVFVTHVAIAFIFVHHMSHSAAYEHTAERTEAVVGWRWGGGIYVNHAFAIFWIADVIGWWKRGMAWAYGSSTWYWTVQGIFAFMFMNATIVFGPRYWIGIAAIVAVIFFALSAFTERCQKSTLRNDNT